jgi:hypothetical protein
MVVLVRRWPILLGIVDAARPHLSDETAKYRRGLIVSSTIAIAIAVLGLVPTRISALGIELSTSDQQVILGSLGLVVAYFAAGFALHGLADASAWVVESRQRYRDQLALDIRLGRLSEEELVPAYEQWEQLAEDDLHKEAARNALRRAEAKAADLILEKRGADLLARGNLTRSVFEFALPIALAVGAEIAVVVGILRGI